MIIPTLQLPPNHRYSHGDRDFYWNEEEKSWIRSPNHRSSNDAQFTRSTPVSPVYPPQGNGWYNSHGSARAPPPVLDNGNYSGLMDQYQQRQLSSEMIDQHERVGSKRARPRSAIALGQSQTAHGLANVSLGAFGWLDLVAKR